MSASLKYGSPVNSFLILITHKNALLKETKFSLLVYLPKFCIIHMIHIIYFNIIYVIICSYFIYIGKYFFEV